MIKPATTGRNTESNTIDMKDMSPGDIGRLEDGTIVMRTFSSHFEVMDLSHPSHGGCWDQPNSIEVILLTSGENVTLTVK